MSRRILEGWAIVLALATALHACPVRAQTCNCIGSHDEPFAGATLDTLWSASSLPAGCASAAASGGALVMTKHAGCVGAAQVVLDRLRRVVCGDFDIRVSYDISAFPVASTGSGRFHALLVDDAASGVLLAGVERYRETPNSCIPYVDSYKAYTTVPGCTPTATYVATSDVVGRYRLQRVGGTVTAYFWNGSGWTQVMSRAIPTTPVIVAFTSGTNGTLATGHVATFDDLSIVSDACPVGVERPAPAARSRLAAITPQPMSGRASIAWVLAEEAVVELGVFDGAGRRVRTLVSAWRAAGAGEVAWDGRTDAGEIAPAGVYCCRLRAGKARDARLLIRVR